MAAHGERHWNSGAVRGTVLDMKERTTRSNHKPYLELRIAVPSGVGRDLSIMSRLWGEERIKAFKTAYKKEPARAWQFLGLFEQLKKDTRLLDGFQFYKFERFEPTPKNPLRTTVALTGELTENTPCDNSSGLSLLHIRVKNEMTDKTFEVFAPDDMASKVKVFGLVKFHGQITDLGAFYNAERDIRTVADRLQGSGGEADPF